MTGIEVIVGLDEIGSSDLARVGGKAANLGELRRAGLPVPDGFVVTTTAYREARADGRSAPGPGLREAIARAYADLDDGHGQVAVAVRSSATSEDQADTSYAGQQESFLNVTGIDAVVDAVAACWASLHSERARVYRAHATGAEPDPVIAVVVQVVIDADASGVMFTANPTTGDRQQILISAAWGLGESVVGGLVDPDELVVVDDQVRRRTATKKIMTVRTAERTEQVPVPPEQQNAPVLDDETARVLADLGRRSADHFGRPQDLEWARSQDVLYLVQSRPITALPEPSGPVPSDWSVPDPDCWYFRASIVEQLPDPLSPLFASMIDDSVRRSLQALMKELLGRDVVGDHDVGLPTINGYAYYAYAKTGMIKITLQAPLALPVLREGHRRSGIQRWREVSRPAYLAVVERWRRRAPGSLDDHELLSGLTELLDAGTTYYTSVQTIIPVAACSELIFSWFYRRLVRHPDDPTAVTLLLGGDSEPIRAEKSLWDLSQWVAERPALAEELGQRSADDLVVAWRSAAPPTAVTAEDWAAFRARLDDHLRRFGHTVYNLDFLKALPVEDPAPMLETVRLDVSGRGIDPYARQAELLATARAGAQRIRDRLGRWRRPVFDALLAWARRVGPIREDALADVGLAWPQLRELALDVGQRLVSRGSIDRPEEVFWLTRSEIETDLVAVNAQSRRSLVGSRRETWRGQRQAVPPQVLPRNRWTRVFDGMLPAVADHDGDEITGLAASAGKVTAVARVIRDPSEFGRLQCGEVLVAAITTPAWTSLFTRAAAVVTDIGGPLSHSSIVAREYGIPAVLGTGVATRRIPDGALVEVDGDAGTVRVLAVEGVSASGGGTGSGTGASPPRPSPRR